MNHITPHNKKQKGYSLIELVVVLAIFMIIIGVTVDIFISIVRNQRDLLAQQELTTQTNYALGYMWLALKSAVTATDTNCLSTVGDVYELTHCPNGVVETCNGVKFINGLDSNACQEFFIDDSAPGPYYPLVEVKNGATSQNLISDKFNIQHGRFILDGDRELHVANSGDAVHPRITVLLNIQTNFFGNIKQKVIETTISQGD
jgi:prepilin-type N-terminal cleavage/methylation domain-containing protein